MKTVTASSMCTVAADIKPSNKYQSASGRRSEALFVWGWCWLFISLVGHMEKQEMDRDELYELPKSDYSLNSKLLFIFLK